MLRFNRLARAGVVLASLFCLHVYPQLLSADEPPIRMAKLEGSIEWSGLGPISPFRLAGVASRLDKFTSIGELVFVRGPQPNTVRGTGPVIMYAANGDQLVGVVTWDVTTSDNDTRSATVHFSWRDSVRFSDGTLARTTGQFLRNRPLGLVVLLKCIKVYNPITREYVCVWVLDTR